MAEKDIHCTSGAIPPTYFFLTSMDPFRLGTKEKKIEKCRGYSSFIELSQLPCRTFTKSDLNISWVTDFRPLDQS